MFENREPRKLSEKERDVLLEKLVVYGMRGNPDNPKPDDEPANIIKKLADQGGFQEEQEVKEEVEARIKQRRENPED